MSESNEQRPVAHEPARGSMVIYRHDAQDGGEERHRMGVVVGPLLPEPATGQVWVGVRLPKKDKSCPVDLIDTASIVEIQPPDDGEPPGGEPRGGEPHEAA